MDRRIVITVVGTVLASCARSGGPLMHQTPAKASPCAASAPLDTVVREKSQVTNLPQLREHPDLHYPDRARSQGISGEVWVSAIIGPDGIAEPSSIRAIGGMDHDLNEAAASFVAASRYWPGCVDGHPVRVRMTVPVSFRVTNR